MRYVFLLQDYTSLITSQNLDYKMFKMSWKWSVCLSNIAYLNSLCYKNQKN